jgi:glutaredoxin
MKITVYSQPGCRECDNVKSYLQYGRGMEFVSKDIKVGEDAAENLDKVISLGYQATPVTIIEKDGKEHVIGGVFDQNAFEAVLGF